tara:strand:- start:397 stop:705 length:309 start_codon:yes stop_codon:yes gene_type:complete
MRFDDDDGLDEEADFELQTRRFISDTFGHLFAVVFAETTVPLELPLPWWCPRQSMEESAREDDMMTTMIRVLSNAAVVCAVVLRLKTFIQNPNKKKRVRLTD